MQLRDPVHNFISLRIKEQTVVCTPALQRLRGIRQLAMASLVYPGALHTRFDHTLGVMHVAGQMGKALGLNDDEIEIVRLAALLHDIGHGPFSHVSEYALERYADRSKLKSNQKKEKIHELVTGLMILNQEDIVKALGKDTCEKIALLLSTGHGDRVLRQIVSGPLDADKQDYLLRDSYYSGVQYGVFDHHQLHRSLVRVKQPNQHDHELMIKPDGIHAVEQFVLAKYYLTTNVYRHKVRLITDQMIVRAITLGIEKDRIKELKNLYSFNNSHDFAARYAEWDDARFMETFGRGSTKKGKCRDILLRLKNRHLFKRIFSGRVTDFSDQTKEFLLTLVKQDRDAQTQKERDSVRHKIESAIASMVSKEINETIDPDFVIYHAFAIKSVKEMSRNDEASILVWKLPLPPKFEDESALFRSINEGFNEEFIEVYAPINWDHHTKRDKTCDNLRSKITDIIECEIKSYLTPKTSSTGVPS